MDLKFSFVFILQDYLQTIIEKGYGFIGAIVLYSF